MNGPAINNLIAVLGPTAAGKTQLAIKIAKHFRCEIFSCDSRQIFKELSIGTAKPTEMEMQGIRHYFINSITIRQPYSVGHFEKEAVHALQKYFIDHDKAILVGGSGLYADAIFHGFDEMVETEFATRKQLNLELENNGLAMLLNELEVNDPVYFQKVDRNNPQRIIRALEVIRTSGKPFSDYHHKSKKVRPWRTVKIGLELPRELLYERINQRVDTMLASGLLNEVKGLIQYRTINALQTVGYKEIFDFLEGKFDWNQCVELLKRNSRRYAKRQLTWFKKSTDVQWFDPREESKIMDFIHQKIGSH